MAWKGAEVCTFFFNGWWKRGVETQAGREKETEADLSPCARSAPLGFLGQSLRADSGMPAGTWQCRNSSWLDSWLLVMFFLLPQGDFTRLTTSWSVVSSLPGTPFVLAFPGFCPAQWWWSQFVRSLSLYHRFPCHHLPGAFPQGLFFFS